MSGRGGRVPARGGRSPAARGRPPKSRSLVRSPASSRGASPAASTRSAGPPPRSKSATSSPVSRGKGRGRGRPPAVKVKRRSSVETTDPLPPPDDPPKQRKTRRPKFQDNPPAPEIVETKALQKLKGSQEKNGVDDTDEEEVDAANGHENKESNGKPATRKRNHEGDEEIEFKKPKVESDEDVANAVSDLVKDIVDNLEEDSPPAPISADNIEGLIERSQIVIEGDEEAAAPPPSTGSKASFNTALLQIVKENFEDGCKANEEDKKKDLKAVGESYIKKVDENRSKESDPGIEEDFAAKMRKLLHEKIGGEQPRHVKGEFDRALREKLEQAVNSTTAENIASVKKLLTETLQHALSKSKVAGSSHAADDTFGPSSSDFIAKTVAGAVQNIVDKSKGSKFVELLSTSESIQKQIIDELVPTLKKPPMKKSKDTLVTMEKELIVDNENNVNSVNEETTELVSLNEQLMLTESESKDGDVYESLTDISAPPPVEKTPEVIEGAVTLDQLDANMVPVDSVDISYEDDDAAIIYEGSDEVANAVVIAHVPAKPKSSPFDKSKLFSQMEDKFAKETHDALKNKPVYKKRKSPPSDDVKPETDGEPVEEKAEDEVAKILIVREPGEVQETEENKENVQTPDEPPSQKEDVPEAVAFEPPPPPPEEEQVKEAAAKEDSKPDETTSSSSSSDLIKSLRMVRMRKERKSSQSGDGETSPRMIIPRLVSPSDRDRLIVPEMSSSKDEDSPTKAASPRKEAFSPKKDGSPKKDAVSPRKDEVPSKKDEPLTRKVEVPTPKDAASSKKDDVSSKRDEPVARDEPSPKKDEPLQIEIPEQNLPVTVAKRKSPALLRTSPHRSRIAISPTILSKVDAEVAATAVQISPIQSLNGGLTPIRTVIRLPKVLKPKEKPKRAPVSDFSGDDTEDDDIPLQRSTEMRKRNQVFAQSKHQRSSVESRDPSMDFLGGNTTEEEHETGKQTPDSQRSTEDKEILKSMVVPEKASSFNIHPERTCSDICYYCGLKFGSLDTPLHISQLKTVESQKFALTFTGFGRDACLCDKCFRYLDRRARNKDEDKRKLYTASSSHVRSCFVRNCNREVTTSVSKKWLIRLKKKLSRKVAMDWEKLSKASVKTSFPMCHKHNNLVENYSQCGLCKRKLSVGGICTLGLTRPEIEELNMLVRQDNVPAELSENTFVCKLCKTFCSIKQKATHLPDYLKNHKAHKAFYKDYRRRLHVYLGLELPESEKTPKKIHQVSSQSDNPTKITIKTTTLEVPEKRKRRHGAKDLSAVSPSSESRMQVQETSTGAAETEKCSVNIQFDLNTKRLWQDLHFPYGNYTSFFRHLILLEKYWRSGDLSLSDTASQKASVYLKSVHNRIKAYEGKNKCSDSDLSASTRPDLDVPPAPQMLHLPFTGDEGPPKPPPPVNRKDTDSSTILKIPKIPMPKSSEQPQPPTKIRVRTDLMHLGLMAKPVPNLMEDDRPPPKPSSSSSLVQLLNESPAKSPIRKKASSTATSEAQSSNSQLFKESGSGTAIPLTFNNSIAEVLAAANKSKAAKEASAPKPPDVTITSAKPKQSSSSADLPLISNVRSLPQNLWNDEELNKSLAAAAAGKKAAAAMANSSSSSQKKSHNPLIDMSKLLHSQNPVVAPHIVAQNTLPGAKGITKIAPKPGPLPPSVRPVQLGRPAPNVASSSGITTVNKKSLHTVLDRLNTLKTPSSTSSLVQQLQAPPMTVSRAPITSATHSITKVSASKPSTTSPMRPGTATAAAMSPANMFMGFSPAMVGQNAAMYPWMHTAAGQAQAALSLMAAGLPGMSQVQAAAAMQEIMKMSNLSGMPASSTANSSPTGQRSIRAPPPLTHMGRPPQVKPKND